MKNGICPKCNSRMIIKDKPIPEKGLLYGFLPIAIGFLSLTILGKRKSWLTFHRVKSELRAWICGECGYTEFYATNFRELLEVDRYLK